MSNSEFPIEPAIRLEDGRIISTMEHAIKLVREHETRPGVDDRDEVLHQLERAQDEDQRRKAVARFRAWLADWGITIPVALNRESTRGQEV